MEYRNDIKMCSICEASTHREPFKIDGKTLALCDTCYYSIKWVAEQVFKKFKK